MDSLRAAADDLGLHWCGIAPAINATGFPDLVRWIDAGYAGEMSYIPDRLEAYRHPKNVLDGVRSIIVLAMPYDAGANFSSEPTALASRPAAATVVPLTPAASAVGSRFVSHPSGSGVKATGRIARYAWSGTDYHDIIHPKLKVLCKQIASLVPGSKSRGIVDTAPLMEREVAQLAGFGWQGKNTLLLNKQIGSYFFLACVLTDVDLPADQPHDSAHCGTCTACLDACPTDAFPQPGVLDATRCISYLTIEHRGQIPVELREGIGDWMFGCDVCQEVCPWNTKRSREAPLTDDPLVAIEPHELFDLDEEQFRARFRKTPLWRTRRRGILRNAAIVLGNSKNSIHVAALSKGLHDSEPIIRGASAWALGQIGADDGLAALRHRLSIETDEVVRSEIEASLSSSPA